jgi:hypothetical protein
MILSLPSMIDSSFSFDIENYGGERTTDRGGAGSWKDSKVWLTINQSTALHRRWKHRKFPFCASGMDKATNGWYESRVFFFFFLFPFQGCFHALASTSRTHWLMPPLYYQSFWRPLGSIHVVLLCLSVCSSAVFGAIHPEDASILADLMTFVTQWLCQYKNICNFFFSHHCDASTSLFLCGPNRSCKNVLRTASLRPTNEHQYKDITCCGAGGV